jgi:hypothetical protein
VVQPPIVAPVTGLSRLTRLAGQVLIIAAALAVLGYAIGYSVRFVSSRLQPPAAATEALVLAAVEEKLVMCAKAAVFEPTSCPQKYYASDGEAVSWSMHGDPMDGAKVSWNAFSKMFDVYGIAVMVVRYTDSGYGAQVDVVAVGYHATLAWDGEKALIRSISGEGDLYGSGRDTKADGKSRSALPELDFQNALRQAFDRCLSVREPELPPECPSSGYDIDDATDFRWSLAADPLLNATFGYDDRFGLVTISGDYVFGLDYREKYSGAVHKEYSGPYEASLIVENGIPVVLQIRSLDG